MVAIAEQGLCEMDVIEHDGEHWLVPEWLQHTKEGWMTPIRIIRLIGLQHQRGTVWGDFLVNDPIPEAVIEGRLPKGPSRYTVVERPDIRVPTGGVQ
ncbi:hypothetical protein [Sphingomonas jaspsi]|uniref:hypothetical protein n=1 Tax=Sphingomonas jaspsi TaxID=392409 RepID=UPI00146FC6D5|nr:hypothetical protein [Sphingomonas jaspsi]